jgi:hypothetical protein
MPLSRHSGIPCRFDANFLTDLILYNAAASDRQFNMPCHFNGLAFAGLQERFPDKANPGRVVSYNLDLAVANQNR